jgi:quinol monooxygenase YgiN
MAIGAIFEVQGGTLEQYNQVVNEVLPNNTLEGGLQYHVAGASENGITVVEVWDSQESLQKVFDEKLGQALQRAGISVQPRFFEVHNIIQS